MPTQLEPAVPRTGAGREKLLAAALDLFAERGVSGTSLQMIADALGVTKAAVYYHYKTKDDIVLAVVSPGMEELAVIAGDAERKRSRAAQVETVLVGIVDLIVRNRSLYAVLQGDLTVAHILSEHMAFPELGTRLMALLAGPDPDPGTIVAASMLLSGLREAGFGPRVASISDEELRGHMLDCARRLLRHRRPPAATA
ncbi:TetR/AcrR family transcriptional regulator [Protofrankia symbiont of Coriaria ruscifolia]|uniref:Regulatory protein TetR n=1 Tax=Candidatus Protofrankia californiensis TaxID=1839754 RepID=A0A1C3NZH9_9ACTN|nr:TetR/AcrR family transcriptional regulator [Protofrankia symbiont of Coriaria ruscifolia]SBW22982.1 regulatory protein TetR [Candidatus Protofrankia californiensis]